MQADSTAVFQNMKGLNLMILCSCFSSKRAHTGKCPATLRSTEASPGRICQQKELRVLAWSFSLGRLALGRAARAESKLVSEARVDGVDASRARVPLEAVVGPEGHRGHPHAARP